MQSALKEMKVIVKLLRRIWALHIIISLAAPISLWLITAVVSFATSFAFELWFSFF